VDGTVAAAARRATTLPRCARAPSRAILLHQHPAAFHRLPLAAAPRYRAHRARCGFFRCTARRLWHALPRHAVRCWPRVPAPAARAASRRPCLLPRPAHCRTATHTALLHAAARATLRLRCATRTLRMRHAAAHCCCPLAFLLQQRMDLSSAHPPATWDNNKTHVAYTFVPFTSLLPIPPHTH